MKFKHLAHLALLATNLSAQIPVTEEAPATLAPPVYLPGEEKIYELYEIEKPPAFPGRDSALNLFLANNLRYPVIALENAIAGKVVVSFLVDTTGALSNIRILRDIGGGCGKETLRLVSIMPAWTPGEYQGRKVKVRHVMPVKFSLH